MIFRLLRTPSRFQVSYRHLKSFALSNKIQIERLLQSWESKVPVECAKTLPSGFYTSRDVFELERYGVFGHNWICAGPKSQLKEPGDFITDEFLSQPYIIALDKASTLSAHYNVCCHHGMILLKDKQGQLKTNEIICPYHGWVYDINGRLRKAMRLKNIQDFKASTVRLMPISIRTIGPFMYLNFNFLNRKSVQNDLSHIEHVHKNYLASTDYENMTFASRTSYHIKCNWKVFVDNYLDGGYHVPYAHKDLCSILNTTNYKILVDHPKTPIQCSSGTQRASGNVVYAYIYPNLMINRYGPFMDTNLVVPVDERNCIVHMDYYYDPKSTTNADEARSQKDSETVQREDIYLCENVQRGLESQAYDSGRYVPTVEYPMHDFHKSLYDELEHYYNQYIV